MLHYEPQSQPNSHLNFYELTLTHLQWPTWYLLAKSIVKIGPTSFHYVYIDTCYSYETSKTSMEIWKTDPVSPKPIINSGQEK